MNKRLKTLIEFARSLAVEKTPRFYRFHSEACQTSGLVWKEDPLVGRAREDVRPFLHDGFGHGIEHARKVAIDAGAIILTERKEQGSQTFRLIILAHFCGLLHDICRLEDDHAKKAGVLSRRILSEYPLTDNEKDMIYFAVENHEAFNPVKSHSNPDTSLLSNAMYDADKFRWGPDNFTTTLWEICDYKDWSYEEIRRRFPAGLDKMKSIRSTFRSQTGKDYGPEFIDMGLELGSTLYKKMLQL